MIYLLQIYSLQTSDFKYSYQWFIWSYFVRDWNIYTHRVTDVQVGNSSPKIFVAVLLSIKEEKS